MIRILRHVSRFVLVSCTLPGCWDGPASAPSAPTPPPRTTPVVTALVDPDVVRSRFGVTGGRPIQPVRLLVLGAGEAIAGVAVHWATTSGSISPEVTLTDQFGIATATWTFGPVPGPQNATVVVPSAGGRSVVFQAQVFPVGSENTVLMKTNEGYGFLSTVNGSSPAVDTIAVGSTLLWQLDPFDYDQHVMVTPGATPSNGGVFTYATPSIVSATYRTPGTFVYRDSVYGTSGTVVVR